MNRLHMNVFFAIPLFRRVFTPSDRFNGQVNASKFSTWKQNRHYKNPMKDNVQAKIKSVSPKRIQYKREHASNELPDLSL